MALKRPFLYAALAGGAIALTQQGLLAWSTYSVANMLIEHNKKTTREVHAYTIEKACMDHARAQKGSVTDFALACSNGADNGLQAHEKPHHVIRWNFTAGIPKAEVIKSAEGDCWNSYIVKQAAKQITPLLNEAATKPENQRDIYVEKQIQLHISNAASNPYIYELCANLK